MRHSPFRTRRKSSTGEAGQEERLERVRLWTLEPMRTDSRRRMAGGELRLGTDSTYMGLLYKNYICQTRCYTFLHGYIMQPEKIEIYRAFNALQGKWRHKGRELRPRLLAESPTNLPPPCRAPASQPFVPEAARPVAPGQRTSKMASGDRPRRKPCVTTSRPIRVPAT